MKNTLLDKNFENVFDYKIRKELLNRRKLNAFKFEALNTHNETFRDRMITLVEEGYSLLSEGRNIKEVLKKINLLLEEQ